MATNNKKVTVDQLNTVAQGMATKNDARFVKKDGSKVLSTNDYTTEDKNKLGGIETGANNYTLPDATESTKGGVTLSNATNSSDTDKAATPAAVKAAYDLASGKQSPATTLSGYGIGDAYTKTEVDAKIKGGVHARGSVATYADLPADPAVGDMYNVVAADAEHGIKAGDNVVYIEESDGTKKWDNYGGTVDLSGYATTADVEVASAADIQAIVDGIYAE